VLYATCQMLSRQILVAKSLEVGNSLYDTIEEFNVDSKAEYTA